MIIASLLCNCSNTIKSVEPTEFTEKEIATQQSIVVDLSICCNKGSAECCEQIPEEKKKLGNMLGY